MNYRMLLIVSFLTLMVGVGGIFFIPTEETVVNIINTTESTTVEKKPEKLIKIAELKRDIHPGTLLQVEDYSLSELKVEEDNPLVNSDLTQLLEKTPSKSLQGHLIAQSLKAGSLLSEAILISPEDPKFLISSLDPKQEVAYRVYLKPTERYILETVRSGDYVSVYNQQIAKRSRDDTVEKYTLLKLFNDLVVLQVKEFERVVDETNQNQKPTQQQDELSEQYIGYISIKVKPEQAKMFYSLERDAQLIVLPSTNQAESINKRGTFIRKLRGNE